MRAINTVTLRHAIRKSAVYTVTACNRDCEVLVFEADALAVHLKHEEVCYREIEKSYKNKMPGLSDSKPHFNEYYSKYLVQHQTFTQDEKAAVKDDQVDDIEETKLGLPSPNLRQKLLNGTETDTRHEMKEIVNDFPKIKLQKNMA
jgi:hypothetical protein